METNFLLIHFTNGRFEMDTSCGQSFVLGCADCLWSFGKPLINLVQCSAKLSGS